MQPLSVRTQLLGVAGWLFVSFGASAVGAIASIEAKSFYGELIQPAWAPAPGVFAPVWTVLFTLMAIAAWLVWRTGGIAAHRQALTWFVAQLAFNSLWSWLFFAWRLGGLALADIALLWILIVITLVLFWRVRPLAGALLLPYLLWVSFAFALNLSLWQLNPQILT